MEYYKNKDLKDIVYFCEFDLIWKTEVWKDIPDYEELYQASDLGRIKGLDRFYENRHGTLTPHKGRIMKQVTDKDGYLKLALCKFGIRPSYHSHRLIALAFIENPENKPQVNHKNGIKTDNRKLNLEWNTNKENMKHAFNIGLCSSNKGSKSNLSKITEKDVLEIRKITFKKNKKEIAEKYGIHIGHLNNILLRKTWKHI